MTAAAMEDPTVREVPPMVMPIEERQRRARRAVRSLRRQVAVLGAKVDRLRLLVMIGLGLGVDSVFANHPTLKHAIERVIASLAGGP